MNLIQENIIFLSNLHSHHIPFKCKAFCEQNIIHRVETVCCNCSMLQKISELNILDYILCLFIQRFLRDLQPTKIKNFRKSKDSLQKRILAETFLRLDFGWL